MKSDKLQNKQDSIKLSVIVPVYNVEPYIRRCLDSLLAQTYQNIEIILVDDGSTDNSGKICDEYAQKDTRICVFHKENGGIASARQEGLLHATGEYATNVDPDDWVEEKAYETMVDRLEEYHPDMLVFGYKKEFAGFTESYSETIDDGFYPKREFWEAFNKSVKKESFFCQPIDAALWNKAFKTELWRSCQNDQVNRLTRNVDDAVVFPCLLDVNSVYVEKQYFYHYCVRHTSILWNEEQQKEEYERFLILADILLSAYFKQKDVWMDREFVIYKLFYHLLLSSPEKLIFPDRCSIYPEIHPQSRIIIYGKGVMANRMIDRFHQLECYEVVDNIDKSDLDKLQITNVKYDHIVIAIANSKIVDSSIQRLIAFGIPENKILCVDKKNLTIEALPDEVRTMIEEKEKNL
jgi:glycosyltransferase involved in cell wall biosynthesis